MKRIDPTACVELLLALRKKHDLERFDALAQVTEDYPQLTTALRKDAEFIFHKQGEASVINWFERTFES